MHLLLFSVILNTWSHSDVTRVDTVFPMSRARVLCTHEFRVARSEVTPGKSPSESLVYEGRYSKVEGEGWYVRTVYNSLP